MITGLITCKLRGKPEQRTGRTGTLFYTAKGITATGDGESIWTNIICFSAPAGRKLMALETGDSVSLVGSIRIGTFTAKDGTTKVSIDVTAEDALTAYQVGQRRAASKPAPSQADAIDDEWLRGGRT